MSSPAGACEYRCVVQLWCLFSQSSNGFSQLFAFTQRSGHPEAVFVLAAMLQLANSELLIPLYWPAAKTDDGAPNQDDDSDDDDAPTLNVKAVKITQTISQDSSPGPRTHSPPVNHR